MGYRDRLPLPSFGASRYPGDVGSIELPGGLVPGAPHTPSGGPRRMLNGAFGRLAPVPRESAPLPHPDMQDAVPRGGMGDYADDIYRSGMVQATTPGMQDMIQEFLARSAGNRQANNLNWGINQQVGWIDDQGREIQAHYVDRLKSSSNFIDKAVQSKWFPAIAPLTTIGLLTYAAGAAYDATGASKGDTSAAYAGGGSAQYQKPAYISTGMSGLRDGPSGNLVLTLAAADRVHKDIESGRSLSQVQADLNRAQGFLNEVQDSEYQEAAAAVASAQRDYNNFASRQDEAQSAASGFQSATAPGAPRQAIDTGSGSSLWDTWAGSANDATFGRSNGGGEYDAKGALNLRSTPIIGTEGTSAGDLLKMGCDKLPFPLSWACENPGKTLAGAIAAAVAVYAGPSIIKSGKSWSRAVRS